VITVTSGKGGVGKTNLVGNLAISMAEEGKKVLIFDADLGLANIDIIFSIHPELNIGHVIRGEHELKNIIVEAYPGIDVIPAPSGETSMTNLSEGQQLNLLAEFETIEGVYDIVLIDTAAGIASNVIYFNMAAEECMVVVTGEPTSITDAYGIIKVMFQKGAKRFKLIVNMVKDSAEAKSVYLTLSKAADRFLNGVVLEYMGFITYDTKLRSAVTQRKPVLSIYPDSISARQIKEVSKIIMNAPRRSDSDGNIKFFMKRLINQARYDH
jgi:flagellar biosynthesis protein FlhG